ncbi:MAG: RNHCP domain-containing protein [Chloroflexota bacterium]
MSRTYRSNESGGKRPPRPEKEFRCRHCGTIVGPTLYGGQHRNHCPYCLYSRHMDGKSPGDRDSDCLGLMAPVGVFTRPKGEYVIVHRCLSCGFERHNRIAGDDDFDLVRALPSVAPRGRQVGSRQGSGERIA